MVETNDFGSFLKKRDQPTDGPMDGRKDTPSYRDARTHLKMENLVSHLRSKN